MDSAFCKCIMFIFEHTTNYIWCKVRHATYCHQLWNHPIPRQDTISLLSDGFRLTNNINVVTSILSLGWDREIVVELFAILYNYLYTILDFI